MREINSRDLDNWITGHYGEDQFRQEDADAEWEERVQELEAEGLTRSDAQAVVDAQYAKARRERR